MKKTLRLSRLKRVALTLLLGLSAGTLQAQTISFNDGNVADRSANLLRYSSEGVATLRYTTDGNDPTASSDPLPAGSNQTLDVSGLDDNTVIKVAGFNSTGNGVVLSGTTTYTLHRCAEPTFTLAENSVTAACTTSATIRYYYSVNDGALTLAAGGTVDCSTLADETVIDFVVRDESTSGTTLYFPTEASYTIGRYAYPTLTRSGDDLTLTNPNENGTNSKLMYYINDNSPQDYTGPITVTTTNTTYHFYVTGTAYNPGSDKMKSYELVTTVVPLSDTEPADLTASDITENRLAETITNSTSAAVHYRVGTSGNWSTLAAGASLDVSDAEADAVYQFAHVTMRTEAIMLGSTEISSTEVADAVSPNIYPVTISRYPDPTVIQNFRQLSPFVFSVTAPAGTPDAVVVRYTESALSNLHVNASSSTVPAGGTVHVRAPLTYRFRTFGLTDAPARYPSAKTLPYPVLRYDPPSILNFDPGDETNHINPTGTLQSATNVIYINYSHTDANGLLDPDPSDANTYDVVYEINNTNHGYLPAGITNPNFKMVVSTKPGNDPTKFPSTVVTVSSSYTGYYVIAHYDATAGKHFYLALDSTATGTATHPFMYTTDTFDHSCLWFYNGNNALVQRLFGHRYFLMRDGNGKLCVQKDVADNAATDWDIYGNYNALVVESMTDFDEQERLTAPMVRFNTTTHQWELFTYVQGESDYPQQVVFPAYQRIAAAAEFNELEDVRLSNITYNGVQPNWITIDQANVTLNLSATLSGKIVPYVLPAHLHYTFTDDGDRTEDFTFYVGPDPDNPVNLSYSDHRELPSRVRTTSDHHINFGSVNAHNVAIRYEWRRLDGLAAYQTVYPNQKASFRWPSSLAATDTVVIPNPAGGLALGSYRLFDGLNAQANCSTTASLVSLANGSSRTDTVVLVAICTLAHSVNDADPTVLEVYSRPLEINFGRTANSLTARDRNNNPVTFQNEGTYLLANCGDRATTTYNNRHYLTTNNSDPATAQPVLSKQAENMYRAFKVTQVDNYYTFENVGLSHQAGDGNHVYLTYNPNSHYSEACFDEGTPAVRYATTATVGDNQKFKLVPYAEESGNIFFLLRPKALEGTQGTLCPLTGSDQMTNATHEGSDAEDFMEGTTLRIGPGRISLMDSHSVSNPTPTTGNFSNAYFYGGFWQLVVPTLLPPQLTMDRHGNVSLTDEEATIRSITGQIKYQISTTPSGDTWSDEAVYTPGSTTITLAENNRIRYWKEPATEGAAIPSPQKVFKAIKMAVPGVTEVRNYLTFSDPEPTQPDGPQLANAMIRYTTDGSDPDDYDAAENPSVPETYNAANGITLVYACNVGFRAYADNYLCSDLVPFPHTAYLQLSIDNSGPAPVPQVATVNGHPAVEDYVIVFTTNGQKPEYHWDDPTGLVGEVWNSSTNPLRTNVEILRIMAFPASESAYRSYYNSNEERIYSGGHYIVFSHVDNPAYTFAQHQQRDTLLSTEHDPVGNIIYKKDVDFHMMLLHYNDPSAENYHYAYTADGNHGIDSTLVFRLVDRDGTTYIYNGSTGTFLGFDENYYISVEPYTNLTRPISWTWGGAPTYTYINSTTEPTRDPETDDHYTLSTVCTENETTVTRYLVYVDNDAAHPWQASTADEIAASNGHMHKKVAYEADLKPYIVDPENADPALRGQDFSPKGVNLFVEDGTDNWVPLATDNNAWIANVENETVRLRASLQGLRIQYASNIDINIYNTAYDRGNPADPNTFVPWQQWHQFYTPATNRENQWYSHSYKDVPGYSETYVDDEQTEGTITWSDLQGSNCSTYYQNRTVSSGDRILSFERTGTTATTPDFTTLLTVRYEHGSSYDNSGTPLDRTVTLRLFADKADATTAPALPDVLTNHDGTRLKLGDGSDRYLAVLPDKLATADEVIGAPFLLGQATLGIAPYSSAAFWTIEQRTENTSLYTLHNQAFRHYSDNGHESGYSTYHRASDRKGGIYIVDMDENTNEALFNYLHPVEGNAPRSPFDQAVYNANMRYAFRVNSGGTVSILSDLAHPDIVYSASDNTWQHRRRGAVQLAENETAATLEACTTDFWGRRWIPQEAPQTPPTIALYPDGKVKLTHPDQDEQTLTFKYQIVDGENAELPTDWPTGAIPYDDANRPTLTDNQKIFTATVKEGQVSQGVTSYVAYRTPTPTLQIDAITGDTNYILGEGTNMVVGYNQRKGNLHYNTNASAVVSHTEGQRVRYSATMSEAIDNGSIISILSWEMGKLESVPLRLGKQQDITLAITAIDLSTAGEALVTARLTSATQMQPILDYIAVRYEMDDNVDPTTSTRLTPGNTPSFGNYITVPEVTGVPNAISIQFKVDLRDYEANAAPVLYLKAYPDLYAFYNESNEARQTLISSDYTGSMPTADEGVYPIESAAEYVSVVNAINAPATHDTYKACSFKVTADSLELGNIAVASIADFQGYWNGNYCKVKGLKNPMFTSCTDAHVYNVVLDYVAIDNSGVTGAICCTANGNTRIYNSGVRATTTSTVQGFGVTGGLVGQLNGNSRVINCYNFANVISTGANAGGIVGGQEHASDLTQTNNTYSNLKGIVFNCMNYGDVTASGSAGPVLAGSVFTNNHKSYGSINTYNYYRYELEKTGASIAYNCARAAEERFLTRFEFFRGILNSNLKKCGWWTYASSNAYSEVTVDGDTIGKWVLDPTIAPYPVVLPKYEGTGASRHAIQYASVINPDYANASTDAPAYRGKKLGTLSVTVASGAQSTDADESRTLNITDMDTTRFDFNYGKVQLPYYQDIFGKGKNITSNGEWIVTGWDITTVPTGTNNFTTASTGTDNDYNFADPKSTNKDQQRTFAQGGYYNVPEGVTAITITAHWGKAVYLGASRYDYTFNEAFTGGTGVDLYGTAVSYPTVVGTQNPCTTMADAVTAIGSLTGVGSTVFDRAIVLVNNVNLSFTNENGPWASSTTNFTFTSLDEDNDHEPDYCCFVQFDSRRAIAPVRFDFIWMPGLGTAIKIDNGLTGTDRKTSVSSPDFGIFNPKGWFEITETALLRFGQFEFYGAKPLILQGGVIEQFVSAKDKAVTSSNSNYIHLGGHVWFKAFAPGIHGDNGSATWHCPVSVTGGDYEKFYLSGAFNPNAGVHTGDSAHCYLYGGRIGLFASGGQERITGSVTVKAHHIFADEFYGGGTNPKMWGTNKDQPQIQGNIHVYLYDSKIGTYAGTQFSSMAANKTLTTVAENTEFDYYYGAGIGGSGLNRDRTGQSSGYGTNVVWTSGAAKNNADLNPYNAAQPANYKYGKMIVTGTGDNQVTNGIVVDYEMEFMPFSGFITNNKNNQAVARFYRYEASLSKANTNGVTSKLTGCTINHNFYGGGFVGRVNGTANSTLTDCTVHGYVFGGGNNADIPYIDAYDLPKDESGTVLFPSYNSEEAVFVEAPREKSTKTRYYWKYDNTKSYTNGTYLLNDDDNVIYTDITTDDIGVVDNTVLVINGNSKVFIRDDDKESGKVFGGGHSAPVRGTAQVTISGNAFVESDVFGGGNIAPVDGSCTVKIGKPRTDFTGEANTNYKVIDHRPWIKGDIYGGGNEADVKGNTSVTVYAGIVGPVYGGCCEGSVLPSSSGSIPGNTEVNMLGGWVGYRPTPVLPSEVASLEAAGNRIVKIGDDYWNYSIPAAEVIDVEGKLMGRDKSYYGIFGGGFGLGTVVAGTATVHVGDGVDGSQPMNTGVHIYGSVYGGGEAGQVNGGYKAFDTEGLTSIPNDGVKYYKFTEPDGTNTNVLYPVVVSASTTIDPNESYYTFIEPSFTNGPATEVVVSTNAESSVYVEGAVFGGGRGYMVNMLDNEEANFVGNEVEVRTAMAGAVYGNAEVTVGKPLTDRNKVQIKSIEYFTPKEKGEEYRLVGANDLTSGAVYWKENLYVFDVTTQRYEPVTPGEPFEEITVRTKEGGKMKMNRSANKVIDGVQYYLQSGRVSVAGGGELGVVYSSTALDADRCIQKPSTRSIGTMTGGNTTVTLKSGLLGDVHSGEVDGCVYGGGLQATVDGVAKVYVASEEKTGVGAQPASHYLWVRGDIYAGGCMGEVLNFQNQAYATEQVITGGWLRNAHGGSNLVEHNSRGNSHLRIGATNATNANNDNILISESAYGGNGFSPSDGYTTVEVHSGKIGFAYTNVAINTETDDETDKLPDPSENENAHTIVPNDANSLLAYEGNVYGGGFGAMARVNKTNVTVDGGIIRNGVFGGGEVAPVYVPGTSSEGAYIHKFYNSSNAQDDSVAAYYVIKSDPLTTVNVSGGEMAMVCGGGRGYTSFITTTTGTPGAIMGNTSVTISGGTVRSFSVSGNDTTLYYSSALGGGNVYGGGLEGIVTGNTEVHITGGEIKGNAFAGGRGYSKAMFVRQTETIKDRSSREAGWVLGNTLMDVTGGKVRQGVYGGGEGLIYKDGSNVDIVACVQGNATVKIHGGYVGTIYDNTSEQEQFNYAYGSYAGGRVANVLGYANMLVYGDATVSAVYGGNDITGKVIGAGRPTTGDTTEDSYNKLVISERTNTSDEASVVTSTYVRINSINSNSGFPKVGRVFGGGNGDYDYYNATEYTHLNLTYPNQPSTYVDLSTTTGNIGMACGGGNKAPVVDALVKYHGSGHVDTIFAGGNSTTVTNSATVLFDATTTPNDNQVDYLFGGNNRASMDILPDILLTKGTVGKVYGGGNRGAMVGYGTKPDVFGRDVTPISTYVLINSEDVKVTDAVFGGCNNAPVRNLAYVDMRNGSIEKLFGGNDVSETAYGARVDMVGGTVQKLFGGGNGYYNYTRVGYRWNVTTKEDTPQKVVDNSKGYPYVDTTNVNIWGGTVNNSVYGGGYAGDCRITHVVINDAATYNGKTLGEGDLLNVGGDARIEGTVFGGGYGDQALLGTVWDGQNLVKHDHVGNVKGQTDNSRTLARTDLYHVSYLEKAFAYGGGEAGDVENAVINVYPSWNKRFDAIYGGCWGSDVRGTATVNLYCEAPDPTTLGPGESPYNITYVYGGNDFTGTVNRSVLNIYSGRYDKVFGGGNGLYSKITLDGTLYDLTVNADGTYSGTVHPVSPASPAEGRPSNTDPVAPEGAHIGNNYGLTVPNSMFPVTNIYDKKAIDDPDNTPGTIIDSNVYGGGNLGISRVVKEGTPTSLSDYAFVQVNVHGGQFGNDIFAGAAGKADMEALIQGLKVLNMDGGNVTNSVYGGSESVNDGYPVECLSVDWTDETDPDNPVSHTYDTNRTTMRPSSVLNLVGGYIGNNVYGAGYLGLVDGSVYVNVGKEAVEQSVAYNRGYRYPNTTTYARYNGQNDPYMPHFVTEADESTGSALGSNLIPADLTLNASIYNGANWGNLAGSDDGTPSYMFTTPGFHGGESRIRIDGEGYKTSDVTGLPLMDIKYSLIGAGTSCEGGDVVRDIRVLNYGKWENCSTTKELFSIQRADSVVFKNVGLTLTGDQDAFSAYPSSKIAMTRCDTVVFIEHNTLQLEKPAIKLHHLAFVDADPTKPEGKGNVIEGQEQLETMYNSIDATTCNSNTSDHVAECLVVSPVAGSTTLPYATILVNNGAYIDIFDENESSGVTYYDVKGYGFLRAEDNTQAVVTARCKRAVAETVDETTYNAINTTDGGFLGLCPADNTKEQFTVGTTTMGQFNYDNYGYANNTYRAWKFGTGIRMRQVTLIAHTNPSELPDINKNLTVDTIDRYGVSHSVSNIAVAMATLELPPTTPGSHYELVGGITVDQENREMVLVDAAFIPDDFTASTLSGSWMAAATATALNPVAPENATPEQIAAAESARQTINAVVNQITQHPSNTFGLALARGESFDATCASGTGSGRPIRCNPNCQTAINGNAYFDGSNGYATTLVDPTGATNVKPSLNLYLTYAKDFTTTLMGDVKFTLTEKDASNNVVGYVEVTISLSTILQEFKDQKYDLVAMKNKFDRHTYSRKLILPASMQKRSLYLTGIEWEPVFEHSTDSIGTPANFALTDTATAAASATRATLGDNTFGLRIMPTEDLSASLTTTLGWYSMAQDYASGLDVSSKSTYVHTIATDNAGSTATRRVYSSNPAAEVINGAETTYHRIIDLKNSGNSDKGEMVGVLDGRSSAAVDFTLYYNDLGETPYVAGVRGKVKLYFDYYQRSSAGSEEKDLGDAKHFTVTLNIKTRDKGDTIYVASAPYIERDGIRLYPYGKVQGGLNGSHYAYNSGNGSNGTYSQEPVEDSPTYLKKGKEPMAYVQSFEEALKYPVYEEGNVICVLDEVRIDNKTTFSMHGSSGNPIPIVRYTGSHYQFPGEECAYRGPMVSIREEGQFACHDVIIDGRMVGSRFKLTQGAYTPSGSEHYVTVNHGVVPYYATEIAALKAWDGDTLRAFAPVFEIRDGGILSLGDNVQIRNCWNAETTAVSYTQTLDNSDPEHPVTVSRLSKAPGSVVYIHKPTATYSLPTDLAGSLAHIANPTLIVSDNLTIEHNVVGGVTGPDVNSLHSGAIYLEDGVVEIGTTNSKKAIKIQDNYALPAACAPVNDPATAGLWATDGNTWSLNTTYLEDQKKANVYLHWVPKTLGTGGAKTDPATSEILDEKSAYVSVNNEPSKNTRIGISKEFPGGNPAVRDTMVVARVTNGRDQYATRAYDRNIFTNDNRITSSDGAPILFRAPISPSNLYFQRCATFKKQLFDEDLTYNTNILPDATHDPIQLTNGRQLSVLTYEPNNNASCPDESDMVTYSVHGGFYPYTYSWSWGTDANNLVEYSKFTTPYTNEEVNADLYASTPDYTKATESNSNTAPVKGKPRANSTIYYYSVTATDLAGCELTKKFNVNITYGTPASGFPTNFNRGSRLALGTDDAAWNDTLKTHVALATRQYTGLHLEKQVVPAKNPAWGDFTATYDYGGTGAVHFVGETDGDGNDIATRLCPGDVINLSATGQNGHKFLQWDFDPYDEPVTSLVMPNINVNKTITAYFSPGDYWKNVVDGSTTAVTNSDYVVEYDGDVHIYTENGLAWLISQCNGLNGQQVHTFFYDTVFIHPKSDGTDYDMSDHLWTPLGIAQNPFGGVLTTPAVASSGSSAKDGEGEGEGEGEGGETPVVRETVTIKGIIVNEPMMDNVGFFGNIQDATIDGLNISYSVFRGQQYVGGIAAQAKNSTITNSSVNDRYGANVTIITGNHTTGGIVADAENTNIDVNSSGVKFMGATVYSGGIAGHTKNGKITNNNVSYEPKSSTLYSAGIVGYYEGTTLPSSSKSSSNQSIVNNYVRFAPDIKAGTRVGGLVGTATNALLANNYVYGHNDGARVSGGLAAVLGNGVHVENCFYEQGFDRQAFGFHSTLDTSAVSTFSGSGNNVILTDTLGRNVNLTRQLNRWVRAHGDASLSYWRSDTSDINNGYPLFGEAEYQEIVDTFDIASCDSFRVDGTLVNQSGLYFYRVVDSTEFTDSLITVNLTINYGVLTELSDTILQGDGYDGYGFHLTATEIDLMRQALQQEGTVTVVVTDTLQTLAGCDSIVTLYLTLSNTGNPVPVAAIDLKVYPNPTIKNVNVEGSGIYEVELYDAVSRRLSQFTILNSQLSIDLEGYPAGAYYLRIRTDHGTVIKKVIKR